MNKISLRAVVATLALAGALVSTPSFAKNDSLTEAMRSARWDVFLGGGIIAGSGAALIGPAVSAALKLTDLNASWSVYVGGDSGLFFHFGPTYMLLPLMVKGYAKYRASHKIDLRAGLSLGGMIGIGTGAASGFAIFLEPGIDFWLSNSLALSIDPRFGGIDGATVFALRVGATIPF